jgi:hypothetical protein
MLRVTYIRRGSKRTTSKESKRLAKQLQTTLKRVTPRDTGRLTRGWRVSNYNSYGFTVSDDVYYGYWVDQGNTRGLVGREFVDKGVSRFENWFSSTYGFDISQEYRVKIDRTEG